ncbi:tetratricopeptide repeat protein [Polyangium jinanense]|uniref:Tetratricopeptide repeat protein n=1 Tax=Polyangium jinanense TaxID=2829994 RepID=A0A9X4ATE7_9BACT|nr:tetratricopeptide repeat protein [Polyangium jinanense]MDC3957928.1 tetratricopeptide repeat protein [Polyangium jinanense]MDC3961973.1 tetratricopeptide repeat protein [Polyangium jinanense]MDC3983481.1 tetratricopeptide repeat protein [Polyangium jinanense]
MSREDKQSEEGRAKREDEDAREAEGAGDDEPSKARASGSEEEAPDEAAQRVAAALGVAGEEDASIEGGDAAAEPDEDEKQEAAKPNRAARRREDALARRKKRVGGAAAAEDDAALPRDKNARAKELLKRRREQADAAERRPVASSLDAGEMVDDALARSASALTKWLKANVGVLQWVVLAALVGAGGYAFWSSRVDKKLGDASADLFSGVAANRGLVMEEDKRPDDQKELDPTRVFKNEAEKSQAALDAYGKVIDKYAGTGAALLARLGQGGTYLEKREWDKAIEAYASVLSSPLAAADPDVKGRATEGIGYAKEGKGDLDGAMASFKELASIDVKGYKDLATYHEARLLFAKGNKDKAKEILKPLEDKLALPSKEPEPLEYLKSAVHDLMVQIDPTAAAAQMPAFGGGGAPAPMPADIQEKARRLVEEAQKKAAQQQGGTP